MSIYYDLIKKPDVRQTGEPQSLYARAVPKGTIDKKEFIDRVHRFTGISRSVLEGSMTAFMDELRDCLVGGWTVELGELGYFSPSLNCRPVMEKERGEGRFGFIAWTEFSCQQGVLSDTE